ncbi:MAG: transcription antitermination protein NusB [Firmicutes bacterium]|nr:transcription antitermination protein NusB [Bacillota bacterium]
MNNDNRPDPGALPEEHMPEPAPGRRVISFSLPETEPPVKKRGRKPKVQKAVDEYEAAGREQADAERLAAAFAAYNREDYKDLSPAPRRRSREAALLILFAATHGSEPDETWSFGRRILQDTGLEEDNAVFAMDLARQAYARREECDRLLAAYARDWSPDRFPAVDLSILRLACAELLDPGDVAPTVIINEAVELAKKFSGGESGASVDNEAVEPAKKSSKNDSAAFVNGMLDNIYKYEIKDKQGAE